MSIQRNLVLLSLLFFLGAGTPPGTPPETLGPESTRAKEVEARGRAYTHLMRAVLAAKRGAVGTALDEIDRAVELQPRSADLLSESADLLLWTGRQVEAEKLARRALEIDPEHLQTIRFLADQAGRRAFSPGGNTESRNEARRFYERLAQEPDVDPQVLAILVQLRLDSGDLDAAVEAGQRLVLARPGDREASQTLAQLMAQQGRTDDALAVLIDFVAIHPDERDLFAFVEKQVRDRNAWEQLNTILTRHEPLSRSSADLHLLLGEARLRLGDAAGAVSSLEGAQRVQPAGESIRYFLGLAYQGMGRMADASEIFVELVAESPENLAYQRRLAETLEAQGKLVAALERYRTALDNASALEDAAELRDDLRRKIAGLLLGDEDYAGAAVWLDRVENPEHPIVAEMRARLALRTGDLEAAEKRSRQLLDLERPGVAALVQGEIAVKQQRWDRAASSFETAIKILGAFARHRAVAIYDAAGVAQRGEPLLREWAATSTLDAEAQYALGVFLHGQARFDEAEASLREAFRLEPRHAPALNFLGYTLAERGTRLAEALELIGRALEIDPWNGAFLDSLGWAHFMLGQYDQALSPLEQAAREMPSDPTILEHLGDLYDRLGRRQQALTTWSRALEHKPEDPAALKEKIRRVEAAETSTQLLPDAASELVRRP